MYINAAKAKASRAPHGARGLKFLRLCCRGWGYVQIAEELHCSPETVRNRVRSIKDKIIALGCVQPQQ